MQNAAEALYAVYVYNIVLQSKWEWSENS